MHSPHYHREIRLHAPKEPLQGLLIRQIGDVHHTVQGRIEPLQKSCRIRRKSSNPPLHTSEYTILFHECTAKVWTIVDPIATRYNAVPKCVNTEIIFERYTNGNPEKDTPATEGFSLDRIIKHITGVAATVPAPYRFQGKDAKNKP
jgi:hypothetical protein